MDKRFWSGAILVATVVVAGASALPGLLLRPASLDEPLVITAPAPKDSAPVVAKVEPVAKPVEPAPQVTQPPLAQAEPVQSASPAATPRAAEVVQPAPPQQSAAVAPAPPVPAPAAQAAPGPAFPPVQPIGVATQSGLDAPPTQSRPVSAKPEGAKPEGQRAKREKTRMTLQDAKARKRPVRPAIYPLREFFAWR